MDPHIREGAKISKKSWVPAKTLETKNDKTPAVL